MNVGTPRIYVNLHSWAKAMGLIHDTEPYFTNSNVLSGEFWEGSWQGKTDDIRAIFENGANPVKAKTIYGVETENHGTMSVITQYKTALSQLMEGNCYLAFLNHNLASEGARLTQEIVSGLDAYTSDSGSEDYSGTFTFTGGVNAEAVTGEAVTGHKFKALYDGFSIAHLNYSGEAHNRVYPTFGINAGDGMAGGEEIKMGGFAFGNYYDFPHSPDLNLTMSIENDGITTQQTKGGATLTNALYTSAPKWGDLGAWELGEGSFASTLGARGGRRVWNLTFSYLSDKNVLPINALGNTVFDIENASNYTANTLDDDGQIVTLNDYTEGADSDYFNSNILDGEDFFSAVWNKTMGGHLPFLFQQDKNNSNPDQFAICRFDMNSLNIKAVAYNTYTISLKIRECW